MSSRFIDGAILMYLRRHQLVGPNKPIGGREEYEEMEKEGEEGFVGAYVKEPVVGLYDWIYSVDITSLYPSTIITLNISSETKVGKIEGWNKIEFDKGNIGLVRIGDQSYTAEDFKKMISDYKFSIASNGTIYSQDVKGVIPVILDTWFSERVEYRNLAKKYKDEGNKELEEFYDRRQKRQKIFMNSIYGSLGLPICRWYDRDNAEATTLLGQTIILNASKLVNSIYNEKLGEQYKITYDDGTSEIIYKNQKIAESGILVKDILNNPNIP
jgi:DNA polymerase elongation subunit (family B)